MSVLNEQELPSLEETELLLEDRAFVDHFNVFLSLPVFGQQVIYCFQEKEFEFVPPIRRHRYFVHRRAVIDWLRRERLPYFLQTRLYVEYLLCCRLRDVGFHVQDAFGRDQAETPETTRLFTRNLLSHLVGMHMFRDSLWDTCGEKVYNCWQDIELMRRTKETSSRRRQYQYIKTQYLHDGGPDQLYGKIKSLFYCGKLNFEIVVDNLEESINTLSKMPYVDDSFKSDCDEALTTLQGLLLEALRKYWVPRYVLHVLNTTSVQLLQPFFRLGEGEDLSIDEVERLVRCRRMFPRITMNELHPSASSTEVYTSNTAKDDPRRTVSSSDSQDIKPEDLLVLWGGGPIRPPTNLDEVSTVECLSRPWSAVSWAYEEDSIATETPDSPGLELESPSPNGEGEIKTPSGSSISNMLQSTSSVQLPQNSLSRMVLSSIERQKLDSMPLLLRDYILGRRDGKTNVPRITKRTLCALSSDSFAGCPFMHFLKQNNLLLDINYLNFWEDVRSYLRMDDKIDQNGNSTKRLMARTVAERYLLSAEEDESIFSEGLKMALLDNLARGDDDGLFFAAHDIVSSSLYISWRNFVRMDRKQFAKASCGTRLMWFKNTLQSPPPPRGAPPQDTQTNSLYFKEARQRALSAMDSECSSETASPDLQPCGSKLVTLIGEEHRVKALEHSIMMVEDVSLMPSMYKMADLVKCCSSNYGSLDLSLGEIVRQEHLKNMVIPKKIDIAGIKVSKKVILPEIALPSSDKSPDLSPPKGGRLVIRRNGIVFNLPSKPRSFNEVLGDPQHYEFFKRLLLARKVTVPLQFWKAVEDLKETVNYKAKHIKTKHIFRRFFSKQAKHGVRLECNDEVIRQIPFMGTITPGMMVVAQASVYRMMERKWFQVYLDSFPADADPRNASPTSLFNLHALAEAETAITPDWLPKRKTPKRRTYHLWHGFVSLIREFLDSMKNYTEMSLFQIYLKRELDRMSPSEKLMETREGGRGRDSMSLDPAMTRVVVRNKVVVINKLPKDLEFWMEVDRYKQQVDGMQNQTSFTKADMDLLTEKANAIITCFLASDVLPRVQINIPYDLALNICNNIHLYGPHRGLFHDACVLIFPILYNFWKKFSLEWLDHNDAGTLLQRIVELSDGETHDEPHSTDKPPDYTKATIKDIKTYLVPGADEYLFHINFTLLTGIRILLPKSNCKSDKLDKLDQLYNESVLRDLSGSPQRRFGGNIGSVASHHSTRNLKTVRSTKLSPHREEQSSGNIKKDSRRASIDSNSVNQTDLRRNKARRLSVLVENLNIQKVPPAGSPIKGGRRASRTMTSIAEVLTRAQAFAPEVSSTSDSSPLF